MAPETTRRIGGLGKYLRWRERDDNTAVRGVGGAGCTESLWRGNDRGHFVTTAALAEEGIGGIAVKGKSEIDGGRVMHVQNLLEEPT